MCLKNSSVGDWVTLIWWTELPISSWKWRSIWHQKRRRTTFTYMKRKWAEESKIRTLWSFRGKNCRKRRLKWRLPLWDCQADLSTSSMTANFDLLCYLNINTSNSKKMRYKSFLLLSFCHPMDSLWSFLYFTSSRSFYSYFGHFWRAFSLKVG